MVAIDITDTLSSEVHRRMDQFRALVQRYHADADYRRQVEADPVAAFREQGMELPSDIEVRVLANTNDTFYVVLLADPNTDLGDESLAAIAGGGLTLGSAGSLSTVASTPGATMSSIATTGTVGTMGVLR